MILTRLRLRDFRTYENLDISFEPGLTLVLGEHATGKTNLVDQSWGPTNEASRVFRVKVGMP